MSENYTFWLTLAVFIGAAALVGQAVALYLVYTVVRQLQAKTAEFLPKAEATLRQANLALTEGQAQVKEVSARVQEVAAQAKELTANAQQLTVKAHGLLDMAHGHVATVGNFMDETTGRARVQVDKVEALIDDTLGRTRHTVALLNETATRPIREVSAVGAGLRAAMGAFFAKRRDAVPAKDREGEETLAG